jgi:dTDP-glucose 4,6-dehydratase
MNISKIQRDLGWQPSHLLKDGLLKTVRWYLENREWVETIRKQNEFQAWLQQNYAQRPENK